MRMSIVVALVAFCMPALAESGFTLKSADVKPGATLGMEQVFNGFGCTGGNVSPELSWQGATGPKELVAYFHPVRKRIRLGLKFEIS